MRGKEETNESVCGGLIRKKSKWEVSRLLRSSVSRKKSEAERVEKHEYSSVGDGLQSEA